ncbi:MAG TPA: hypothetical protein VFO19_14205 [Vicinamibacterales bacterium]|nr:hypothetical protein [Vicinamibacterales bacterium]
MSVLATTAIVIGFSVGGGAAAQNKSIGASTVAVMSDWLRAVREHTPGKVDDATRWALTMTIEQRRQFDLGLPLVLKAILHEPLVVRSEAERTLADLANMVPDAPAFLHRAVILHTDAAIEEGPGAIVASASPSAAVRSGAMVAARDGSYLGVIEPNRHWRIARNILDHVKMTPAPDTFVGNWYHAVSAFMLRFSYFGELAPHLSHAEEILPRDGRVQFDLGVLWENRGLPRAQQLMSDEQIRNERFPPGRVRPTSGTSLDLPAPEVANRRAEDRFRQALELDPSLVEARVRLARLLGMRERHQDARREAEIALQRRPDKATAYYAHLFAGRAAAADRDLAGASRHFEDALALYPGAQSALLARSQAALMRGDDREAAKVVAELSGAADGRGLAEDPWWYYHMGPGRDARELLAALWEGVR